MLSFILGSANSDISQALLENIGNSQKQKQILIVPEQASLFAEKQINDSFGNNNDSILVLSFTRLAHLIFKNLGGLAGVYADETSKLIAMNLAINEIKDKLNIYALSTNKQGFCETLLKTADELKNSGFSPQDFVKSSNSIPGGNLKNKALEFADIFSVYDSILLSRYKDPLDDLRRAKNLAQTHNFFEDTDIFFDGFLTFNGSQFEFIQTMLEQTNVLFSLCCETDDTLFSPTQKTVNHLISFANTQNITVQKYIHVKPNIQKQGALLHLERNILRAKAVEKSKADGCIDALLASNEYDEIDAILSKVKQLTKDGFKYNDILLLTRDIESYRSVLISALKKYDIPYFMDETVSAEFLPILKCALGLLSCSTSFNTESILQFLKSDMTVFSDKEIGIFENYIYTWDINKNMFEKPFTQNPRGFGFDSMTDKDKSILEIAEKIRKTTLEALNTIKASEEGAKSISLNLLSALDILGVKQRLTTLIKSQGDPEKAKEISSWWDILIELLEVLVQATGKRNISLNLFTDLFKMATKNKSIGKLPMSQDCLLIGSADRTISDNVKAVFIFGANDGVFPYSPTFAGIFSNADRVKLSDFDINLSKPIEECTNEERLIAYRALCCASEYLCVSARLSDISGSSLCPSEVITSLTNIFESNEEGSKSILKYAEDQSIISLCHTDESAFLQLAFHFNDETKEVASLKEYFSNHPIYKDRFLKLQNMTDEQHLLKDKNISKKTFPTHISPSQIEMYYQCPFSYFCKYGLSVKPVPKAKLDAPSLGSIVHAVLEDIVALEDFLKLSDDDLKTEIDKSLKNYLENNLGGKEDKSARFFQMYKNVGKNLFYLCQNIQKEFLSSKYKPSAFELSIGNDGDIKPLNIRIDEDTSISISGKVDRVDTCEIDGKTYLRIVDYKTGTKNFDFSEVYQGLNLQMLLYLFAIYRGGEKMFRDIVPAGVLYLPASGNLKKFNIPTREQDENSIAKNIKQGFKSNGVLLHDFESLDAMEQIEPGKSGNYIPVSILKDGSFSKKDKEKYLLSNIQIDNLFVFVKDQVKKMCLSLFSGEISANPIADKNNCEIPCSYCDYACICGYSKSETTRKIEPISKDDFFENIKQDFKS